MGAAGFIGRRVVAALSASDWAAAVAASRRTGGAADAVVVDATDEASLGAAFSGIDGIVNCVAGDGDTIRRNADAVFGAASRLNQPPRIVHLGSMAAYGSAVGRVDETAPLLGDLDEYSKAKAAADVRALAYPAAVILRPGIVYGPQSPWWSDRIARLLMAHRLGDLGARGDGYCNLVHVDDVARSVLLALRTPAAGQAFNVAMPSPPTWNEYFQRYARALRAVPLRRISARRLAVELRIVAPACKLLEIGARLAGARSAALPPPIRPWLLKLCAHEIILDVAKAQTVLGMQWMPLDAGLQSSADWFRVGGRT